VSGPFGRRRREALAVPAPASALAAAAFGLAAVGAGWAFSHGPRPGVAAAGAIALFSLFACAQALPSARIGAGLFLWVGLLAPLAFTHARTQQEVASGSLDTLSIAQGVVPFVCLALASTFERPRLLPLRPYEVPLACYLLVIAASAVWSVNPLATELKAAQLASGYALLLGLSRLYSLETLIRAAATGIHLLAVAALAGMLVDPARALAPTDVYVNVPRLHGIFPSIAPDLLGFLGAAGVILTLAGVRPAFASGLAGSLGLIGLDAAVLLLSRSRTGVILLAVGVLALVLGGRRRGFHALAVCAVAVVALVVASPTLSRQAVSFFHRGQSKSAFTTLTGRRDLWESALHDWRNRPLEGHGYYAGHRLGAVSRSVTFQTSNLDNTWIETGVDVGLIGLLPLAAFGLTGVRQLRQRRGVRPDPLFAPLLALLLMCALSSFVNPSLELPSYTMIVFGLLLVGRRGKTRFAEASLPVPVERVRPVRARTARVQLAGAALGAAALGGASLTGLELPARRRRSLRGLVTRTTWSLADQGVSSISNFAITIVAARETSVQGFGVFALVYTLSFLALQFSRALTSEPLMVRYSAVGVREWRRAVSAASGLALLVGLAGSAGCLAGGLLVSGTLGRALLALAAVLPFLLVQDLWRFAFFARGLPRSAFVNDVVWTALQAASIVALLKTSGHRTPADFVLVWGVPGAAAALFGLGQLRIVPSPLRVRDWLSRQSDIAFRFAAEFVVYRGAVQLALYVVGVVSGLAALGALRAAQALYGPLNVLFLGIAAAAVPEAVRLADGSTRQLVRLVRIVAVSLALVAAVWCVALVGLPGAAGEALLGKTWTSARPVLIPTGILMIASGASMGPWVGVRALAAARESLRARMILAAGTLVAAVGGALLDGVVGAATGIGAAALGGALVWSQQFQTALERRRDAASAAPSQPL